MFSLVHTTVGCLLAAVLRGCAVVFDEGTEKLGQWITSPALRRVCDAQHRHGGLCYLRPMSTCDVGPREAVNVTEATPVFRILQSLRPEKAELLRGRGRKAKREECRAFDARSRLPNKRAWRNEDCLYMGELFDGALREFGLESDLLIKATLMAWYMRPQPVRQPDCLDPPTPLSLLSLALPLSSVSAVTALTL